MRATAFPIMLACLALAATAPAADDESPEAHSRLKRTVIQLDAERVQPSTATADRDGVIVFENFAVNPITIRFVEPDDAAQKVKCHFVRQKERVEGAPWLLFGLEGGKLSATIPPGRFASLCSLAPGTYTYVADVQRLKTNAPSAAGTGVGSEKGQIVVR
jgi:hypothetical protein